MKYIRLNDGNQIPALGSGTNTFGKENHDYMGAINNDIHEILDAIELGYRHFDTAIAYRNEAVVGKALQASGLDRSEFYLTSKIPNSSGNIGTKEKIEASIRSSLDALQTDYIDLYLIHHPGENMDELVHVWHVLETYHKQGVLKSIGVSNFSKEQLTYLIDRSEIVPAVNQIESHPGDWNDDLIDATKQLGIVVEAWGPLSRIADKSKEALTAIADRYGKTWAQVVLAYQVRRDVVVIPKSHDKQRQQLNFEIFDFTLSEAEAAQIKTL